MQKSAVSPYVMSVFSTDRQRGRKNIHTINYNHSTFDFPQNLGCLKASSNGNFDDSQRQVSIMQGSHRLWKMAEQNSMHGKIMEFWHEIAFWMSVSLK